MICYSRATMRGASSRVCKTGVTISILGLWTTMSLARDILGLRVGLFGAIVYLWVIGIGEFGLSTYGYNGFSYSSMISPGIKAIYGQLIVGLGGGVIGFMGIFGIYSIFGVVYGFRSTKIIVTSASFELATTRAI